jgi:hypothetical protein
MLSGSRPLGGARREASLLCPPTCAAIETLRSGRSHLPVVPFTCRILETLHPPPRRGRQHLPTPAPSGTTCRRKDLPGRGDYARFRTLEEHSYLDLGCVFRRFPRFLSSLKAPALWKWLSGQSGSRSAPLPAGTASPDSSGRVCAFAEERTDRSLASGPVPRRGERMRRQCQLAVYPVQTSMTPTA